MQLSKYALVLLCLTAFWACQPDEDSDGFDNGIPDINQVDTPPNNGNGDNGQNGNQNDAVAAQLGRLLFWDPILSGERDVACVSCHHPSFGYADGRDLSIGVGGEGLGPARRDAVADDIGLVKRNSPTIINTAFNGMDRNGNYNPAEAPMFWDNRARSLEVQALGPLLSFEEMRGHAYSEDVALSEIVSRLESIAEYRDLFAQAFGTANAISSENIGAAIAIFERTIVATDSPFDRFQAGDQNAMTQAQIRGLNAFQQIGCDDCHSGPMFSDFQLHTLGVPDNNQLDETDSGATGNYDFRTPTLRNLPLTGPYFHNGVGQSLQQTLQFYRNIRNVNNNGGGPGNNPPPGQLGLNLKVNPNDLDPDIRDLRPINNNDIQDILQFLQALNDPNFDRTIPASVPSGLSVGGNID